MATAPYRSRAKDRLKNGKHRVKRVTPEVGDARGETAERPESNSLWWWPTCSLESLRSRGAPEASTEFDGRGTGSRRIIGFRGRSRAQG